MSTMETRAPAPSSLWSLPYIVISSVVTYVKMFSESFAEAQRMAREAERRYPHRYEW